MEKLANICIVLSIFFVGFVSLQQTIIFKVNIKPDNEIFYSEFRKKPRENITCESDCLKNCKYRWYYLKKNGGFDDIFTHGSILFLNKVVEKNNAFKCNVINPDNPSTEYGYSEEIKVIIRDYISPTPTTHTVSVIRSSDKTVFSTTAAKFVENDDSFLGVQFVIIISICGAAALLLITIAVLVGILCVRTKQKQNKRCKESRRNNTTQEKDRELELTENTLYITADNITEMPPSNHTQNNTPTVESGNDVYAVVNKPSKKTENQVPEYADVRNSQPEKDKPTAENNPSGKEEKKPGQNVNKDGMVYVEIDFKDMPSNGKSTMQGVENKTLYADIDSIKQTETQPTNEKESHAE